MFMQSNSFDMIMDIAKSWIHITKFFGFSTQFLIVSNTGKNLRFKLTLIDKYMESNIHVVNWF